MKIKTIEVKNFKAVTEQTANFDGCSAIITAGNDKGKTSLLRGLIDRFRSERPEYIVKDGEEKGYYKMELTDGAVIEWNFTEKSERFTYTTPDGLTVKNGVLQQIGGRYFGSSFDIDKFLNASPREQSKQLQKLCGVDFSDLDEKEKTARDNRTYANRQMKEIIGEKRPEPTLVEKPETSELQVQLDQIRKENNEAWENWKESNSKHLQEIESHNQNVDEQNAKYLVLESAQATFNKYGYESKGMTDFVGRFKPNEKKPLENMPEPILQSTEEIEQQISKQNEKRIAYERYLKDKEDYDAWVERGKQARKYAEKCEKDVKEIEAEKQRRIAEADMPKEFSINGEGVLYKGLPLDNNQISSSAKYIAALKLGAMVLGDVRALHFDASFLDKNSLQKVQEWANENDLQLLIERPDFDSGEIKYEII